MIIFPSAIAWPATEREGEREREGDCRIFGAGTWCRKRQHFSTYIENARFCFILRAKLKLFDLHFNECNISCSRNASLGFVPGAEGKEGRVEGGGGGITLMLTQGASERVAPVRSLLMH